MFGRRRAAALVAEFLGAGALTLLVLSVQRSTIGVPFFVAAAAGLILAIMWFAVGDMSGGYFNPALTLAMWTARKVTTLAGIAYIVAQLLGGWAAYGLFHYFSNTALQPIGGHFTTRILVAEAVGTIIFTFGFTAAVYRRYSPAVTGAFAGVAFMVGIIAASTASLGLLNPSIALGTRAWDIWGSMGWGTYVLGPVLGAIIGVNLYDLLFAAEGESANLLALSGSTTTTEAVATAKRPTRGGAKRRTTRRKK